VFDKERVGELLGRLSNAPAVIVSYIYFETWWRAVWAAWRLRGLSFSVRLSQGADGWTWLVKASQTTPVTQERVARVVNEVEGVVHSLRGDYDGFEIQVIVRE
jgi:hypothetical protein